MAPDDDRQDRFECARRDGIIVEIVKDHIEGNSVLQVRNPTLKTLSAYVSCASPNHGAPSRLDFIGRSGRLTIGEARIPADDDGGTKLVECITFVVTVAPRSVVLLAHADTRPIISGETAISATAIPFEPNPIARSLDDAPPEELCFAQFPLPAPGPYLCTQGCGGMLTHYFSESYHAFDLRCDVGTPLLAMADGVVTELAEQSTASGIHCENLFRWNAIAVTTPAGVTVVYVHIAPQSALVRKGDTVRAGQPLCRTGSAGFSPEPHVHIEAHKAAPDGDEPSLWGHSVPMFLLAPCRTPGGAPTPYVCTAGRWYDSGGEATRTVET